MTERTELYKACKYQVEHFAADHGMTLPELWAVVNNRRIGNDDIDYISIDLHDWWKQTTLEDYRNRNI